MPEQLVGPREFDRDQAIARNERIAQQTGSPGLGGRRLTKADEPERERTAWGHAPSRRSGSSKQILGISKIQAT